MRSQLETKLSLVSSQSHKFKSDNMQFFTVPIKTSGHEMYGGVNQYVLYANKDEVAKISSLLETDQLSTYVAPPQAKTEN